MLRDFLLHELLLHEKHICWESMGGEGASFPSYPSCFFLEFCVYQGTLDVAKRI